MNRNQSVNNQKSIQITHNSVPSTRNTNGKTCSRKGHHKGYGVNIPKVRGSESSFLMRTFERLRLSHADGWGEGGGVKQAAILERRGACLPVMLQSRRKVGASCPPYWLSMPFCEALGTGMVRVMGLWNLRRLGSTVTMGLTATRLPSILDTSSGWMGWAYGVQQHSHPHTRSFLPKRTLHEAAASGRLRPIQRRTNKVSGTEVWERHGQKGREKEREASNTARGLVISFPHTNQLPCYFLRLNYQTNLGHQYWETHTPEGTWAYLESHFDLLGEGAFREDGLHLRHHSGAQHAALGADVVGFLADAGDDGKVLGEVRGQDAGDALLVELFSTLQVCRRDAVTVRSAASDIHST